MRMQVINSKMSETFNPLPNTIIIRITSNENFAVMNHTTDFLGVLELRFDDISDKHPTEDTMLYGMMTPNHYYEIKSFVEKFKSNECDIIVHCDAGQSRSPAVALGILDYLLEDHAQAQELLMKNGHWKPNVFVTSYFRRDYYGEDL